MCHFHACVCDNRTLSDVTLGNTVHIGLPVLKSEMSIVTQAFHRNYIRHQVAHSFVMLCVNSSNLGSDLYPGVDVQFEPPSIVNYPLLTSLPFANTLDE